MWKRYGFATIPGWITLALIAIGSYLYISDYYQVSRGYSYSLTSPFQLGILTAIFGGFILIAAFFKNKEANDAGSNIINDLKTVGKLLLFTSVMYVLAAFMVEYLVSHIGPRNYGLGVNWVFVVIGSIAVILASGSLSAASGLFVSIIKFI